MVMATSSCLWLKASTTADLALLQLAVWLSLNLWLVTIYSHQCYGFLKCYLVQKASTQLCILRGMLVNDITLLWEVDILLAPKNKNDNSSSSICWSSKYLHYFCPNDRQSWLGKVKCYFCCKNLVSQSKITHLVTLHITELQMMIHRKSLIAKKEMILTLLVFKVSGVCLQLIICRGQAQIQRHLCQGSMTGGWVWTLSAGEIV